MLTVGVRSGSTGCQATALVAHRVSFQGMGAGPQFPHLEPWTPILSHHHFSLEPSPTLWIPGVPEFLGPIKETESNSKAWC